MKLPALGVEYVTWTVTADFALDGTLEIFINTADEFPDADDTWTTASWLAAESVVGDVHTRQFQALLAGSAVDPVPGSAAQLSAGINYVFTKMDDDPEVIIRRAGRIEGL